ncbi:MAG: HypC/HybG/HupF family hydrogenase formation chaperone [Acidobacteriia bacterium]|nr:HypC/HybG/HupF family hydrogenase formation chaperone [Terriglobia bacterium]
MCLAIPGKLLTAEEHNGVRIGRVQFGGITREACLDFLPEASVGDYVIVHVGFALSRVDREEAERSYALLESMGLLEGELQSDLHDSESSPGGRAGAGGRPL